MDSAPAQARLDADARVAASVTPAGALRLEAVPGGEDDGLDAPARARLLAAAERGAGHALLHLGLGHADTALAPGLGFARDVGRRFVARLVAEPELEERRARAVPPAGDDDVAALVTSVPPMTGAEAVSEAVVRAWWVAAAEAFAAEIGAFPGTVQEYLRAHGAGWNVVGRVCFHLAENRGDDEHPFAFLATYALRGDGRGGKARAKVAHAPLSKALAESQ
jgi:non-specific serine/threonine protein kinase